MMHLTRFGFNAIVAVYLLPLILLDLWGNTFSTGDGSDLYYYKSMLDVALIAYAVWNLFRKPTTSVNIARARTTSTDPNDEDILGFQNIGAVEYLYCAMLALYAAVNWYFMHLLNKQSEGLVSIATLTWSWLSLLVFVLAAKHFWDLKSGAIVELKKKVMQ